jgi:hypothetical protein
MFVRFQIPAADVVLAVAEDELDEVLLRRCNATGMKPDAAAFAAACIVSARFM